MSVDTELDMVQNSIEDAIKDSPDAVQRWQELRAKLVALSEDGAAPLYIPLANFTAILLDRFKGQSEAVVKLVTGRIHEHHAIKDCAETVSLLWAIVLDDRFKAAADDFLVSLSWPIVFDNAVGGSSKVETVVGLFNAKEKPPVQPWNVWGELLSAASTLESLRACILLLDGAIVNRPQDPIAVFITNPRTRYHLHFAQPITDPEQLIHALVDFGNGYSHQPLILETTSGLVAIDSEFVTLFTVNPDLSFTHERILNTDCVQWGYADRDLYWAGDGQRLSCTLPFIGRAAAQAKMIELGQADKNPELEKDSPAKRNKQSPENGAVNESRASAPRLTLFPTQEFEAPSDDGACTTF